MAHFIQAVRVYGPRIVHKETLSQRELEQRLAISTGLKRSQAMHALLELSDALRDFMALGRPVLLPGIGRFTVTTGGDGNLRIHFRPHRDLTRQLSTLENFQGEVLNRENIGLSPEQYKELWDADNPDDPMELPVLRSQAA